MALKEELSYLVSVVGGDLVCANDIKGVNDRVDALTMICRDVLRDSSLCYIDGLLHYYDGRIYVPCKERVVMSVLGNVLVENGTSATDIRRMGDMPMSVLIDKSHARNPNLLCFANGVADIGPSSYESGDGLDMYAFGPENVVTESLPYPYVAGASCPLWDAFLEEVMPDASMRDVMQEFFGLCYLDRSRMSVEKFAIFIGEGANGKSVIRDVVTAVMGRDNVAAYDAQQITQEKLQPFLNGKRINFASDMRSSASFDSALKALSSGQEVVGRRIYEDPVKVKCPPIVFSMNELPKFCDTTPAFFRRVLLFRFAVVIPEERRDSSLAAKICEGELPGVFNWILRGRDRLLSNRGVFTRCVAMDNEIAVIAADEKRRNDPVLRYLAARGLSVSPLYDGQKPVMVSQDEIVDALAPQLTRLSLTRTMTSFGVRMQRKSDGRYYWVYEIK